MAGPIAVPISIPVRDKVILLKDDSIPLYKYQIDIIIKESRKKTAFQWLASPTGIRIPLTLTQRDAVVKTKEDILNILSPNRDPKHLLLTGQGFGFSKHSFNRILTRIERISDIEAENLGPDYSLAVHPETLEKITQSIIDSKEAKEFAEWNGHPFLNYGLICKFDDRELDIVVNFAMGILIVTMVVTKETGYFLREVYSFNNEDFIEKKPSR